MYQSLSMLRVSVTACLPSAPGLSAAAFALTTVVEFLPWARASGPGVSPARNARASRAAPRCAVVIICSLRVAAPGARRRGQKGKMPGGVRAAPGYNPRKILQPGGRTNHANFHGPAPGGA